MNYERELEKVSERISLMRNLSILINLFTIASTVPVIFLPQFMNGIVKIWIISVSGLAFILVTVALFLSRRDTMVTLFITGLSLILGGIFAGVGIGVGLAHV